jgi:hypothetical protein
MQLRRERSPYPSTLISIEPALMSYPSQEVQNDDRGRVDQVIPKILMMPEVVGWKLEALEEMYSEDNMP